MALPHVERGKLISADEQNALIDQVNENTAAIAALGGGDPLDIQELIDEALDDHINDPTPHPAYDTDSHRFDLIFLNGLV